MAAAESFSLLQDLSLSDGGILKRLEYDLLREKEKLQKSIHSEKDVERIEQQLDFFRQLKRLQRKQEEDDDDHSMSYTAPHNGIRPECHDTSRKVESIHDATTRLHETLQKVTLDNAGLEKKLKTTARRNITKNINARFPRRNKKEHEKNTFEKEQHEKKYEHQNLRTTSDTTQSSIRPSPPEMDTSKQQWKTILNAQQRHVMEEAREEEKRKRERELNALLVQKDMEKDADLTKLQHTSQAETNAMCSKLLSDLEKDNEESKRQFEHQLEVLLDSRQQKEVLNSLSFLYRMSENR